MAHSLVHLSGSTITSVALSGRTSWPSGNELSSSRPIQALLHLSNSRIPLLPSISSLDSVLWGGLGLYSTDRAGSRGALSGKAKVVVETPHSANTNCWPLRTCSGEGEAMASSTRLLQVTDRQTPQTSRWRTLSRAQPANTTTDLRDSRSSANDVFTDDEEEDDDEDDDEYFDDDNDSQDLDDDDLFDAENATEEGVTGQDEEEQPTPSTSSRRLPRVQAVGFEKKRTKRNYEPDQDDEDFFTSPWTDEDEVLQRKYLVNFGRFTSEKWLPLHTAAACGQVANIRYLVQQGVDINGLDRDGFTPLHKAVMNVRDAAVRQLLRLGAKALLVDQDGASLLHYACQAGNISICKMLIRARVPINQKDNDGWTPLHIAAQSGQRATIRTLLMNGADPKARNRDNLTPYDLLKAFGPGFGYAPAKKLLAKPPNRRDLLTGRVR